MQVTYFFLFKKHLKEIFIDVPILINGDFNKHVKWTHPINSIMELFEKVKLKKNYSKICVLYNTQINHM
jgi:hypothetical protein